jgi:hypothetical protein
MFGEPPATKARTAYSLPVFGSPWDFFDVNLSPVYAGCVFHAPDHFGLERLLDPPMQGILEARALLNRLNEDSASYFIL